MPEYSVLYPQTNSLSASGKSKGQRLSSAKVQIIIIINPITQGKPNHPKTPNELLWARVICVRFIEDASTITESIVNAIGSS